MTSRLRRYFVLTLTLTSGVTYYVDILLDFTVLSEWYIAEDYGFFTVSLIFIVCAVLISCLLDYYMATLEKTDGYDEQVTRAGQPVHRLRGQSMLPTELEQFQLDLPPHPRRMWVRCVLNVTFLRMIDEVYWAYLAWSHGRIPAAAFDQVSKNDEFCIKNKEFCIKNKEFCIKMMNFAGALSRRAPGGHSAVADPRVRSSEEVLHG